MKAPRQAEFFYASVGARALLVGIFYKIVILKDIAMPISIWTKAADLALSYRFGYPLKITSTAHVEFLVSREHDRSWAGKINVGIRSSVFTRC